MKNIFNLWMWLVDMIPYEMYWYIFFVDWWVCQNINEKKSQKHIKAIKNGSKITHTILKKCTFCIKKCIDAPFPVDSNHKLDLSQQPLLCDKEFPTYKWRTKVHLIIHWVNSFISSDRLSQISALPVHTLLASQEIQIKQPSSPLKSSFYCKTYNLI